MLRARSPQSSFFDTDVIAGPLLPPESFHRQFRNHVWPLIQDHDFEAMYCTKNGRPAISPALLARALILQYHENLSDREMEAACQYDLRLKYALGLGIDERPFDHSSLGDFRDRLLKHDKAKAIFDRILDKLIEQGLIAKDEPQRIDATHVIADIAIPTMITLVKNGIHEVLKPVSKRHAKAYQRIVKQIDLALYEKNKVNQNHPGRPDEKLHERFLVQAVRDARTILKEVESVTADPILERRIGFLKRILQENIEDDESGTPKEMNYKAKPRDLMVSPIDPDARYGAKSASKKFTGYKANVTETVNSRFITNIKAMRGNRPDGETMVDAVIEQKVHDLHPVKVIGDTAYGDGAYRKALGDKGIQVVAPQHAQNPRTKAVYPISAFHYDVEKNTLTCPADCTVKAYYYDSSSDKTMFHFPISVCSKCSHRPQCTTAREGRRVVGIGQHNRELREAERYNLTDQFKQDMRLRPAVEGKLSELVRYHGMRRARYRGLNKLSLQLYYTATAVNVKRWMKLQHQRRSQLHDEVLQ